MPLLAGLPELHAADAATLAWAVIATAALIALRRRLGAAEALVGSLAAWSAALLLWAPPQPAAQSRLFAGLGFVALAAGRLLREREPDAARAALALCWLAATAAAATSLAAWSAGTTDAYVHRLATPTALVLLAIFAPRTTRGSPALHALAVYGLLLARNSRLLNPAAGRLGIAAMAVAALALFGLLTDLIIRWDRRRRAWERDPSRPPRPVPASRPLYAGLVALALAAAALAAVARPDTSAVVAAFAAAMVCFVAGHVCGWRHAGVLGLLLVAETIVLATAAILGPDAYGFASGSVLAAGWLLWIARFWEQQLLDGRPWTTAGTLIEPARTLARLATPAVAAGVWLACGPGRAVSLPAGLVLAGLLVLLAGMFLRDARTPGRADSAWAGLLLGTTLVLPAHAVTARLHVLPGVPLALWLAAVALILSLPASLRPLPAVRCVIGSAAPAVAVAYALHARDAGSIIAAGLTLVAAGLVLRVGRSDVQARHDATS